MTPGAPSPRPQAGRVLAGRYRLESLLGTGGFGEVYKATQVPFGREVAVKLLLVATPDAAARFSREAALAQRLEHPNTARILDFGLTDEGTPFMVWELLRGQTLADLIAANGPLALGVALRITSQILKSMLEAHGLGIVHRDLKPANIFVTSHPGEAVFVRVLDFGIAKDVIAGAANEPVSARSAIDGTERAFTTHASHLLGTPRYMAPEQARGEQVGRAADIYATGLVLAEMLAGEPVFAGASGFEVALSQASDDPVPIPASVMATPAGPIVKRATQKRADDRYPSAADMLAEVDALSAHHGWTAADIVRVTAPHVHGALATAPTQATPSIRRKQSSRLLVKGLIAGGLAVAAIATGSVLYLRGRAAQHPVAERGAPAAAPTPRPAAGSASARASSLPPADAGAPVDWKTRKIPDMPFEAFEARMKEAGYTVQRQTPYEDSGWKFKSAAIGKDPCTGMFGLYLFGRNVPPGDRKEIDTAIRKIEFARIVDTGGSYLYVVVGSPKSPQCDPECSDRVAALLTDP